MNGLATSSVLWGLLGLCLCPLSAAAQTAPPITAVSAFHYQGRVTPIATAEPAREKGFTVTWFVDPTTTPPSAIYLISEETDALPWSSRFGVAPLKDSAATPAVGYRYNNQAAILPLPPVAPFGEASLALDKTHRVGQRQFTVSDEMTVGDAEVAVATAQELPGRDATLFIDRGTGLLLRAEQAVVLGRGDRFRLTLEQIPQQSQALSPEEIDRWQTTRPLIEKLAALVGEADPEAEADLPSEKRAEAERLAGRLLTAAQDTPWESLAKAALQELSDQQKRGLGLSALTEKAVGQSAFPFSLTKADGSRLTSEDLKGQVIVLHIWNYSHEEMAAPYGQVGYLDFLARKRNSENVTVLGVVPGSGSAEQQAAAMRSARKLAEFMNLGFRITYDSGELLKALGDPRSVGAPLPLWVLIDRSGKVRYYRSGLFETQANEGLKELDLLIGALLKADQPREESPARPNSAEQN